MPSKITQDELLIGGVTAIQAIQAVLDIAQQPVGEDSELYRHFASLVSVNEGQSTAARQGFTAGLIRLLFTAVTDLHGPDLLPTIPGLTVDGPSRTFSEVTALVGEIVADQAPDVARVIRTAHDASRLTDFVSVVGSGADEPATALTLAEACVLVIRRLIRDRAGRHPASRWALVGQLTAPVIGAHFLQVYSQMV